MRRVIEFLSWPFRRLPISLSLFTLTAILLAAGYLLSYRNINQSYRVLRYHEEEAQLQLVERLSRQVDLQFGVFQTKVQNFTDATATAMQLTGLEGAYRYFLNQKTLHQFMENNSEVIAVSITDGLGRQLIDNARVEVTAEDFSKHIQKGTLAGFEGQSSLSPIVKIPGQTAPFVVFTEPVTDAGGTHVAAISVVIDLGAMLENLLTRISQRHTVFMCDDRGLLIVHSSTDTDHDQPTLSPGDDVSFHPLVRNFLASAGRINQVISYQRAGSRDYLGTYATCHRLPWIVACEIPSEIAFASVGKMERQLRFWVILSFAISLVVAGVMSMAFRAPLSQLLDASRRMGAHEFTRPVKVDASNEFATLATTFDDMRLSIVDYLKQLQAAAQKNKETFMRALQALVNAIDAKDPYTKGHSKRVSTYAGVIARELHQDEEELERTELSALLHDVGKIGIDDKILKKPAPLTAAEYKAMKRHPEKGMAILGAIDELRSITDGMAYHHENWDGKGYPKGLRAEEIPLQARIVAVADAFDAMTTNRPYQIAMSYDQAINRLQELAGKRFDPDMVRALAEAYYAGRLKPR